MCVLEEGTLRAYRREVREREREMGKHKTLTAIVQAR
jgi:hypothetical protein